MSQGAYVEHTLNILHKNETTLSCVQCFLQLVSSVSVSVFQIAWLHTWWTDLKCAYVCFTCNWQGLNFIWSLLLLFGVYTRYIFQFKKLPKTLPILLKILVFFQFKRNVIFTNELLIMMLTLYLFGCTPRLVKTCLFPQFLGLPWCCVHVPCICNHKRCVTD